MRFFRHGLAGLALITALTGTHAVPSFARPTQALSILTFYTITDSAYTAYTPSHAATPPMVTAFTKKSTYVAVYFHYTGAKANVTTFHVDFYKGATAIRRGLTHTIDHNAGEIVLDIPADLLTSLGNYTARLYVNSVLAGSAPFTMISTPSIGTSYMITGAAFDTFSNSSKKSDPPKATGFPANVSRVAVYFLYDGARAKDRYWAIVFDKYGNQVHSSLKHAFQYISTGSVALRLNADSGKYPAGAYRTDIYFDGAVVRTVTWSTK